MSRLEELIEQYCPDGVEYKALKTILRIKNGKDYKHLNEGDIPVYGSGGVMTYVDTPMYDKPSVLIPRKGSIDKLYYVDTPFWNVDTVFYTEIDAKQVIEKYVFYTLQKEHLEKLNTAGGVPSLTQGVVNEVLIPVPPLPVQEEIVRILDNFTELQAELQAELQKRRQQYNYYRDNLLSNGGNNAEYLAIPEFAELKAGKAIKATELSSIMDENHSYPCFGGNGIRGFIKKASHNGDYAIIGRQGALCGCVNWASGEFYATEHAVVCTPRFNVSSRYLYHLFTVADLNQYKSQGAQPGLSVQRLNELVFPIPSIVEQQRIVSILDRFDTLTTDLTQGLPAEIEKRRQQYEYYRDKLLTFKRKGA